MRRKLVGTVTLICLATVIVMLVQWDWSDLQRSVIFSGCLRAGLTLGALWMAFPQVEAIARRISPAWVTVSLVALLVVIIRPRALLYVAPLLVVIAVLAWLRRFLKK